MDLASVVAALASVGVRVSGSTPNSSIQGDSSRACPTGLAGPEPSGTHNDPGQHLHTPSAKGNAQANLTDYTHTPKTDTNAKQQGGISIHVFYSEYVYRLLYVREWFVGDFVCVSVWHHVLQVRQREAYTL